MKKFLCILLILVLAFSFISCGKKTAQEIVVDEVFKNIKENPKDYWLSFEDSSEYFGFSEDVYNNIISLIGKVNYEVVTKEITANTNKIKVKITSYALGDAFYDALLDYIDNLSNGDAKGIFDEYMLKRIKKSKKDYSSYVTFTLEKSGENWKIVSFDENLSDAISGGIFSKVEKLQTTN